MNVQNTKKISKLKLLTTSFVLLVCASLIGCGESGSGDSVNKNNDGDNLATGAEATGTEATGAKGTANLSWTAPTTRADNTVLPMSEIGGYKVYMGTTPSNLTQYADISNPSQMEFTINQLGIGTYYFAVTTYNQYGAESTLSTIVSKTI